MRGRLNQKKTSEQTVEPEKAKTNQEQKSEVIKKDSKENAENSDKAEISMKEPDETKLEPEDSVKATEPPENQLFKLGIKLKMLNESTTTSNKNKLKRRNSLESGPNQTKLSSEEQSKEFGSAYKRRNSVGSDNYRQKEEHKDQVKNENPSSVTEKTGEENENSENDTTLSDSTLAVVKDETCEDNKSEGNGDGGKTAEEKNIITLEKEVPRRRKSMEEKSGELVTAGLENGLLLARRNSLESGDLSKKSNDTSKIICSSKLDKEDAEHRSNKDPRSERRIRNKVKIYFEIMFMLSCVDFCSSNIYPLLK